MNRPAANRMGEQRIRRERWGHRTPGSAKGKGSERLRAVLVLESGSRVRNGAEALGLNSLPDKGALSVTAKGKMAAGKASQWDRLSPALLRRPPALPTEGQLGWLWHCGVGGEEISHPAGTEERGPHTHSASAQVRGSTDFQHARPRIGPWASRLEQRAGPEGRPPRGSEGCKQRC